MSETLFPAVFFFLGLLSGALGVSAYLVRGLLIKSILPARRAPAKKSVPKKPQRAHAKNAAAVLNAGSVDYQKIRTAEIELPVIAADVLVYEPGELGEAYPEKTRLYYSPEALSDPEFLQTVLRSPLQVMTHEKNTGEGNRGVDGWLREAFWDEKENRVKGRGFLHGEDNVKYAEANKDKPGFGTSAFISFLEIDREAGTAPNGKPYDAVVRKAVNNHVAILPNVRDPKNVILAMNAVKQPEAENVIPDNEAELAEKWLRYLETVYTRDIAQRLWVSAGKAPKAGDVGKHYKNFLKALGNNAANEVRQPEAENAELNAILAGPKTAPDYSAAVDEAHRRTSGKNAEKRYTIRGHGGQHTAQDIEDMARAAREMNGPEYEKAFRASVVEVEYRPLKYEPPPERKKIVTPQVPWNSTETKNETEGRKMAINADEFKEAMQAYEKEANKEEELCNRVKNAVMEEIGKTEKPAEDKTKNTEPKEEVKNFPHAEKEEKEEGKEEAANALPSESMVKDFSDALGVTFKKTPTLKELASISGVTGENDAALITALNAKREALKKPADVSAHNGGVSERDPVKTVDDFLKSI